MMNDVNSLINQNKNRDSIGNFQTHNYHSIEKDKVNIKISKNFYHSK